MRKKQNNVYTNLHSTFQVWLLKIIGGICPIVVVGFPMYDLLLSVETLEIWVTSFTLPFNVIQGQCYLKYSYLTSRQCSAAKSCYFSEKRCLKIGNLEFEIPTLWYDPHWIPAWIVPEEGSLQTGVKYKYKANKNILRDSSLKSP